MEMTLRRVYGLIFLCIIYCGREVIADLRCPAHWIKIGSSCYRTRYSLATKDWENGRHWCQTQGADLAKLNSLDKMNAVINYQGLLGNTVPFWIGLHKIDKEWQWADNSTVDQSILDLMRVDIPGYDCIRLKKSGGIRMARCSDKKGILCERPLGKPLGCDSSSDWQSYGGKCYKVLGMKNSWNKATNMCNNLNASISSPKTKDEQFALHDFVLNSGQSLWIGLYLSKEGDVSQWLWSDGSKLNLTFWASDADSIVTGRQNVCGYIDSHVTHWSESWRTGLCDVTNGNIICEQQSDGYIDVVDSTEGIGLMSFLNYDTENVSVVYHPEERTWLEAYTICKADGGVLAMQSEVRDYKNVWISDSNCSSLQTTTSAATTRVSNDGSNESIEDFYIERQNDMCLYASYSGCQEANCYENKTFVCKVYKDTEVDSQGDQPTDPAVVAVAILLVIFAALVILLLIVWYKRKKRNSNDKKENEVDQACMQEAKNGRCHNDSATARNNTTGTVPQSNSEDTYDHTTTSQKAFNTPQNIYDHSPNTPGDTYDHPGTIQGVSDLSEQYGSTNVGDSQYNSVSHSGVPTVKTENNYS